MDQRQMQRNIETYILQRLQAGGRIETAFDVAAQLNVPVTMVDRALRDLTAQGYPGLPYTQASEF
jgi:DNA-binding GntR family transcriptional regulator